MHIEYEVRILNIDYKEIQNKLEEVGATFEWDHLQKRYTYDFKPAVPNKWLRLRTNGDKTTLTIKRVVDSTIDGTEETEIEVSDFDETNKILNELGYQPKALQENRRIQYRLNGVEVDIDFWPFLPTWIEIEGSSEEEVFKTVELLGFTKEDTTSLDCMSIYEQNGYNLDEIFELKLEEDRKN